MLIFKLIYAPANSIAER